jgi:hypothetical protein
MEAIKALGRRLRRCAEVELNTPQDGILLYSNGQYYSRPPPMIFKANDD